MNIGSFNDALRYYTSNKLETESAYITGTVDDIERKYTPAICVLLTYSISELYDLFGIDR